MDRPANGHRRHQAGSVTVVDLIRRQEGPVRIPSAHEAATVQLMDDLLGRPDEPPEQRGWLAKSAKLAGLALGSLALCGSVYAASTLTHRPATTTSALDNKVLTGVGALRPDQVAAQLAGTGTAAAPPARPPVHQAGSIATGRATGTVIGHTPPTATATSQPPATPSAKPLSAEQVVTTFYQLVATQPGLASQLLSPALLAGESSAFDQSWHSLRDVEVDSVEPAGSGAVQAVVRLREQDGTWLRVVELLRVTSGHPPLISGAELLSAQHG